MTATTLPRAAPQTDPQDAAERRTAARALLLRPLITADGPQSDILRLVRRHQHELTRLFAEGLGYRLDVSPGSARLFKSGLGRDATRPLRRRNGAAFSPRAYVMLCLAVAALTRSKAQLLVDELVQQVRSAAVDAGIDVDLDGSQDRRALHAALSELVGLGVLVERDGDLEHWVDQHTQSLLDVRRELLPSLLAAPLTSAEAPEALLDRAALPSAAGGARSAIRRRLIESPVLTTEELSDEQAEWWRRNRNRERDWYRDRFGLELELRAEGAAAIDPEDELTDELFPGRDKTRQLALLILEQLVEAVSAQDPAGQARPDPWRPIPAAEADRIGLDVVAQWLVRLRRDQREDPAGAVLGALDVLRSTGLIRAHPGALEVHAAAARFAPRVQLRDTAPTGEHSLFDAPSAQEEGTGS